MADLLSAVSIYVPSDEKIFDPGSVTIIVFAVGNTIQGIFDFNPKWPTLMLAECLLFVGVAIHGDAGLTRYAVAATIINGLVIWFSSGFVTGVVARFSGEAPDSSRVNRQDGGRRFFEPWF